MAATPPAESVARARIAENYGKLPLGFEANRGQAEPDVRFLSRGSGYTLYLTAREAVLTLRATSAPDRTDLLRIQFAGATADAADGNSLPVAEKLLPGATNYLIGNDPAGWRTGLPAFARVHYPGVYPGVDLIFYGNHRQLEYDFVVRAGADPSAIRLRFDGAAKLRLDASGNLVIGTEDGSIAFHKPAVYQLVEGKRTPVAGRFKLLAHNSVGFSLGRYDNSRLLVIDPVLAYSTFLGNSTSAINSIAVDSTGAAYLAGTATSTDYPITPGAYQTSFKNSHYTAFITKLNPSGTALIYSTFLGGSGKPWGGDGAAKVAVDSAGNAYTTGSACSSDFPVTSNAFQSANLAAAKSGCIGFFAKLNQKGTALDYSTYLGGTDSPMGFDTPTSLALDAAGNVYIGGLAYSTDFPTTAGVLQTTNKSSAYYGWNEFIAKINPAASGKASLIYSTYLGGSGESTPPTGGVVAVAADKAGDVFVSAPVQSTDFPVTKGVFQSTNKGTAKGGFNLTVAKINPTATSLVYATYLGGSGAGYHGDVAGGIAVDSSGNAYLAGTTYETNFPVTKGAFQTTNKGAANPNGNVATCFVTKMNSTGTALVYSTFLGGSGFYMGDSASSLAIDNSGDAYIVGLTDSSDFPVTANAYQSTNRGRFEANTATNAFFTELNPAGAGLVYSTFLGGSGGDAALALARGSTGDVFLSGYTRSSNFPVTPDAYQTTFKSPSLVTGFVSHFVMGTAPTTLPTVTLITANANPAVAGTSLIFTAVVGPVSGTGVSTGNVVFSFDEAAAATVPLSATGLATWSSGPLSPGLHYILASYSGSSTYAASGAGITETIAPQTPVISPPGGTYSSAQLVTLTDTAQGAVLHYTTDGSVPTASSTKYTGPIMVSAQQTIRAIAVVPGLPTTAVASASYTLLNAPTVLAAQASAISTPKATLNALVDTYGMTGTYFFRYGLSGSALTAGTPKTALAGSTLGSRLGFVPVQVSAQLTSLGAKTTYYYQVVVSTAAGSSSGKVLSFKTN
jgi:hypothetical protein